MLKYSIKYELILFKYICKILIDLDKVGYKRVNKSILVIMI